MTVLGSINRATLSVCFSSLLIGCATKPHDSYARNNSDVDKSVYATPILSNANSFEYAKGIVINKVLQRTPNDKAKNIVLLIGDGMGVSTVTAARIYSGQKQKLDGESYIMAMETLPNTALSKTYNTNQQVPDSAGTATALLSGIKTRAGVINVGPETERGDCNGALSNRVETLFETAKKKGLRTGIVSTTRMTHATPAATYAHVPERNWETRLKLTPEAKANGCLPISDQLIESVNEGRLDIVMGGGAKNIDVTLFENTRVLNSKTDLAQLPPNVRQPIVGLFSEDHMEYARLKSKLSTEPSLAEMTAKSLEVLEASQEGYILMVEGGRIDHGHHAGKAELALEETYQFDKAVRAVLDKVDLSETLVIVTADHSHVFTIAGYPTRGNPILGQVIGNDSKGLSTNAPLLAVDGRPYTTLGYQNGPGAHYGIRNPSSDLDDVITQQAVIPTGSKASESNSAKLNETHGGEDVPVFAAGPSAHLVSGVIEQNVIYHIMRHALEF